MNRLFVLITVVFLLTGGPAEPTAHPGGTDDEGCHHCRSDCQKWGLEADQRHCHDGSEEETEAPAAADGADESEVSLSEGERVYVEKVLDGDTLEVRLPGQGGERIRVRILGIDCPESHKNPKCRRQGKNGGPGCEEQIPRGLKAAKRAAELVKQEVVRLESKKGDGEFGRGGYDRLLAYVRLKDGRDFGEVLVGEGLCRDYGHKYPHPRHEAYESAESSPPESEEPSTTRRTPGNLLSGCW